MNLESGTIICSHSDDEFLGCARLFEEKLVKRVFIITRGEKQVVGPFDSVAHYTQTRNAETIAFCQSNGVTDVSILNYPDGELCHLFTEYFTMLYDTIEKIIKTSKVVYFHSLLDPHPDHRAISAIVHRILNDRDHLSLKGKFLCEKAYEFHIGSSPKNVTRISQTLRHERMKTFRDNYSQYNLLLKSGFDFNMCLEDWYTKVI